jgi:hypothetical protein
MHTPIVVFAMLASGSICHHWQSLHKPQLDAAIATAPPREQHASKRQDKSGRDKLECCRERFLPATHALPFHPPSSAVRIVRQHPYLRCRLAGIDGGVTSLDLTRWRACGGSCGRGGAAQTWLKMNSGPARTINLR